jgi:hypothetical protein
MTLKGTTPTLTIGDAGAEDTKIVFDGNAQDFYIGLDDSADDLVIGKGSTVGTTPAISIDEDLKSTLVGQVVIDPADGVADDAYALFVRNNEATDGRNYGLTVRAGSTSADESFSVRDHANASTYFKVQGDGKVGIGVDPSNSWDANIDCLQVGEQSSIWAGDTDYTDATWIGTNVYQTGGTTKYLTSAAASVYGQQGGNHYWYTYASGSADATVSGNEVMRIDTAGHVTMPLQSAFLVRPSADQDNIAINGARTVEWATEIHDRNADFNATSGNVTINGVSTQPYFFCAPVAGIYQFNVQIYLKNLDTAANYYELYLYTSNRTYYDIIDPGHFDGDLAYFSLGIDVAADMDAGDTAYVALNQNSGTAQTDISSVSHFSGYLVA